MPSDTLKLSAVHPLTRKGIAWRQLILWLQRLSKEFHDHLTVIDNTCAWNILTPAAKDIVRTQLKDLCLQRDVFVGKEVEPAIEWRLYHLRYIADSMIPFETPPDRVVEARVPLLIPDRDGFFLPRDYPLWSKYAALFSASKLTDDWLVIPVLKSKGRVGRNLHYCLSSLLYIDWSRMN